MISEVPQNRSALVTNVAGYLVTELIQQIFPHRFDALSLAIFLEHDAAVLRHRNASNGTASLKTARQCLSRLDITIRGGSRCAGGCPVLFEHLGKLVRSRLPGFAQVRVVPSILRDVSMVDEDRGGRAVCHVVASLTAYPSGQ